MPATDLELVRDVVKTLEAFPIDARQVFLENLPGSVAGTGGILLQAAMEDARAAAEKACLEASEAAEAAAKELDVVKAAVSEASAAVEVASAEAEATEAASKAAAKEAKEIEKEHKYSEKLTEGDMRRWAAMREERAQSESVYQGSFKLLEAGGWGDEQVKTTCIEAVEQYLDTIRAEKVLVAAVPGALGMKPDDRKSFDKMAVEAVDAIFSKCLADADAAIKQAEPEEREAKAELLGLWALSEVVGDAARAAKDKALLANSEWSTTESRLTLSRKRLREVEATSTETAEKKARADARRAQLEDGKAAAERLKAAPAAEAPAAEAAEAVPADAAAAA